MSKNLAAYDKIAASLVMTEDGVEHGRMMSAPALTWGGKVFAFHIIRGKHSAMGFRLGRDFDFSALPTTNWSYLSPFKTKPPMKDWVMLPVEEARHWPALAELALERMRGS